MTTAKVFVIIINFHSNNFVLKYLVHHHPKNTVLMSQDIKLATCTLFNQNQPDQTYILIAQLWFMVLCNSFQSCFVLFVLGGFVLLPVDSHYPMPHLINERVMTAPLRQWIKNLQFFNIKRKLIFHFYESTSFLMLELCWRAIAFTSTYA